MPASNLKTHVITINNKTIACALTMQVTRSAKNKSFKAWIYDSICCWWSRGGAGAGQWQMQGAYPGFFQRYEQFSILLVTPFNLLSPDREQQYFLRRFPQYHHGNGYENKSNNHQVRNNLLSNSLTTYNSKKRFGNKTGLGIDIFQVHWLMERVRL